MKLYRGSEVDDFLRCRLRWSYAWVENLKAKRPDGKLFFGTLAHKFLELYYRWDALEASLGMRKLFDETDTSLMEQAELDDLWELAEGVTKSYREQWKQQDEKHQTIATELTFAIPLTDKIGYTGTIDLVYLDEDNRLWFSDHKFTNSIERYADAAEMNRQISRYWWALQRLVAGEGYVMSVNGWVPVRDAAWLGEDSWQTRTKFAGKEVAGFVYDLALREIPKEPKLLQKGGLSKDKSQHTTYDIYRKALLEHLGLQDPVTRWIPDEYQDIMNHLLAQETEEGNRFFRRVKVTRNQAELESAMTEFLNIAKEADTIRHYGKIRKARSIYRNIIIDKCSWDCPFKALCCGEMDGSNTTLIRNLGYEKREEQADANLLKTN